MTRSSRCSRRCAGASDLNEALTLFLRRSQLEAVLAQGTHVQHGE